jgi:DNA-binding response OmpR family regulator
VSGKFLVVDDEPKIVRLVRSYLEQAGFTVVEANDGQTALIQARRERDILRRALLARPAQDRVHDRLAQTEALPTQLLDLRAYC